MSFTKNSAITSLLGNGGLTEYKRPVIRRGEVRLMITNYTPERHCMLLSNNIPEVRMWTISSVFGLLNCTHAYVDTHTFRKVRGVSIASDCIDGVCLICEIAWDTEMDEPLKCHSDKIVYYQKRKKTLFSIDFKEVVHPKMTLLSSFIHSDEVHSSSVWRMAVTYFLPWDTKWDIYSRMYKLYKFLKDGDHKCQTWWPFSVSYELRKLECSTS